MIAEALKDTDEHVSVVTVALEDDVSELLSFLQAITITSAVKAALSQKIDFFFRDIHIDLKMFLFIIGFWM